MTASMVLQPINLIAIDPRVRRGRPHILGTTLTVQDVVIAHVYHQLDANEIASDYDVSLAQVYGALAYYHDHKAVIDQEIREQIRVSEQMKENRVGSRHPALLP